MKIDGLKIKSYIKKHGLASIAIGFLLGHSGSQFLSSIVEDLIMPLFNPILNGQHWQSHSISLGPFKFQWGQVMANGLHWVAVIIVVIFVIKILEYEDEAEKS